MIAFWDQPRYTGSSSSFTLDQALICTIVPDDSRFETHSIQLSGSIKCEFFEWVPHCRIFLLEIWNGHLSYNRLCGCMTFWKFDPFSACSITLDVYSDCISLRDLACAGTPVEVATSIPEVTEDKPPLGSFKCVSTEEEQWDLGWPMGLQCWQCSVDVFLYRALFPYPIPCLFAPWLCHKTPQDCESFQKGTHHFAVSTRGSRDTMDKTTLLSAVVILEWSQSSWERRTL